jgi:competence protein ComEA
MERSVTPWRVLEADPIVEPGPSTGGPAAAPWRAWPLLGGLAAAAGLAAIAIALVATGPTPIAVVEVDPVAGVVDATSVPGTSGSAASAAPAEIIVHVAGAVARPGLVRLPPGSRVADAIDAAGGLGPRVDVARLGREVNLAAVLVDAERVLIPSRDDTPAAVGALIPPASASDGLVDLNRATAAELEQLPGIGEVTAAKIIAARDERPFRSLDELLERKVLGPATLEKIRALVVIR